MQVTRKLIEELQNRLKVGSRRGVHLNAIPGRSRYKFDLHRLSYINENIPNDFVEKLLSEKPLKFRISWKDNVPDLNELFEEDQVNLVKITKAFENLINQTEAIESEKGINTFGFGFPLLARRDQKDNKLTVAPVLIWSLRIKRTREFNTWEIVRDEEDPIYLNEVLINHLESDAKINIDQISSDFLDDGLIDKEELLHICEDLINSINSKNSPNLRNIFREKLENIDPIPSKKHFEKLPITSNNSFIDFSGLFSIFEVQKQNIIQDYDKLLDLDGYEIDLEEMEDHHFQPISSVETDPSQQGILHSLESSRNILIQGPPGTGKSQSLTAILVNALENHKKTIVVCEKRTALEVLHNSLNEIGLGRHTVLIKDITKDRRVAVDSVRDRVDYRSQSFSVNSNTGLQYSVEKSKKLIDSINSKHLKIGKKLVHDQNWTQTVGVLLSNLKKVNEDYKLNLDKKLFEYSTDELNILLETLRESQLLFEDYEPYLEYSFLDTSRFKGDNPFLVEREIKDSFESYISEAERIYSSIENYKKDYRKLRDREVETVHNDILDKIKSIKSAYGSLIEKIQQTENSYLKVRKSEIEDQIEKLREPLDKLLELYTSSSQKLELFEKKYKTLRDKEIQNQWDKQKSLIDELQELFEKNSPFALFYSDSQKFSFVNQLKSLFSAETKSIIRDSRRIEAKMMALIKITKDCQDFPSIINAATTKEKEKNFKSFKLGSEKIMNNRDFIIQEEFIALNLKSFFETPIEQNSIIADLEKESKKIGISQNQKDYFVSTKEELQHFLNITSELIMLLQQKIANSRDLPILELSDSINIRETELKKYSQDINKILGEADKSSKKEFDYFFPEIQNAEINIKDCKSSLAQAFGKSSFKDLKDILIQLQTGIKNFEDSFLNSRKSITTQLNESRDFNSFDFTIDANKNLEKLIELQSKLDKDSQNYNLEVDKELKDNRFLNELPEQYRTPGFNDILEQIEKLKKKIKEEKWVPDFYKNRKPAASLKEIHTILKKYKNYIDHEDDIFSREFKWYKFYNDKEPNTKKVILEVKNKRDWRNVFLVFYLDSLLTENADMHLPTDENDHKELDKALSEFGKKQMDYIHQYWTTRQNQTRNRFDQENPNLSIENLYNKRKSHRHQKLSLRQIVKYDLDLFTDFFPIILTTPDVCSNLFQERHKYFDIVLFDEASQLKLEDNLPALLKGKQIVIAGDEHQMPPSNYFSKIFDGSVEDEDDVEDDEVPVIDRDNILLSCESLLDFATELRFDKRFLDFHYRSRHPYLIDFSNHAFYNQRLIPLPNNFDYLPINHIQVNGTYSDHTNESEAEAVLSILENNIHRLPNGKYPGVGIATFNIAQRNLIKSRLLERRKFEKYKEFNDKIQELEDEGLFVKNLENIQGDERDVIILSTTYGINQEGKFNQRFGPINHQKGYKLLNVIITRAKYKIYLCTSIPEKVYLNYKEYLIADGENNRRAVFFAYLSYTKAVSENNHEARKAILNDLAENSNIKKNNFSFNADLESPFEEEVYEALTSHFEETKITPQVQFAGFRIDLVFDPQHPGLPKIAIECDGAAYHSSQEAYLYDRHRQKILENQGFVFHRIWSTNWWRNPKRETKQLIDFIKSIENRDPELFESTRDASQAFTDNIEIIRNELPFNDPEVQKDLQEDLDQIESHSIEPLQEYDDEEKIKSFSKVKVNYLNNNKEIMVELVETGAVQPVTSNGIMKINIKTPLGQALLGKQSGETVKIGKLDNYVEILEVLN